MRLLIITVALSALSGCSFLMPWNQDLTVTAEPDDARIIINGKTHGEGQVTTSVRRNKPSQILVTHPDYTDTTRRVDKTLSAAGTADLVGGVLIMVPALGLLSPGAWDLDQTHMTIILEQH